MARQSAGCIAGLACFCLATLFLATCDAGHLDGRSVAGCEGLPHFASRNISDDTLASADAGALLELIVCLGQNGVLTAQDLAAMLSPFLLADSRESAAQAVTDHSPPSLDASVDGMHPSALSPVSSSFLLPSEVSAAAAVVGDCAVLQELNIFTLNTSFSDAACLRNCCTCHEVLCDFFGRVTSVTVLPAAGTVPPSIWSLASLERLKIVGQEYGNRSDEDLLVFLVTTASPTTAVGGTFPVPAQYPANFSHFVLYGSFVSDYVLPVQPLHTMQLGWFAVGPLPVASIALVSHSIQVTGLFTSPLLPLTLEPSLRYLSIGGLIGGSLSDCLPEHLPPQLLVLDLDTDRLTGSIPSSVYELKQLLVLNLFSNQLDGTLSPAIGNLSQIRYFNVNSNFLSGSIPEAIGRMSQVSFFDLGFNQFSGEIPLSVGNLTSAAMIDLSHNSLSGSLPASMLNLRSLQWLDLNSNVLSGPLLPFAFLNLTYIDLSSNSLTGSFPVTVGDISRQLTHLFIDSNKLSGQIPESLGFLSKLQYLSLYSNQLTGSLPSSLANLSSLRQMDLHANRLNGSIPDELCQLNVSQLSLSENFFQQFPNCTTGVGWVSVDVSSNELTSFPFDEVLSWPSLVSLDVSYNRIAGELPVINPLRTTPTLRSLDLAYNNMSGSFPIGPCGSFGTAYPPSALTAGAGLTSLDVSGNIITGFFFGDRTQCGFCTNNYWTMSSLGLADCQITSFMSDPTYRLCGTSFYPVGLFLRLFPSLQSLNVRGNGLTTSLDDIFGIPELATLILRANPSATLNSSLSPAFRSRVSFDPATLFAYSNEMTCYQATFGESLAVKVDPSFFDYLNCQCRSGYYGKPPDCRQCISSEFAHCSFPSTVDVSSVPVNTSLQLSGNILAVEGYFASPSVSYVDQMNNVSYPQLVELCREPVPALSSCMATATGGPCREGYTGRLCSQCMEGYFASGVKCFSCPAPGSAGLILYGMLLVVLVASLIVGSFVLGGSSGGLFKILLFFGQGLSYTRTPMPSALFFTSGMASSYLLFPVAAGVECFFSDWTFVKQYVGALLLPLILVAVVFFIWLLRPSKPPKWMARCLRSGVFLLVVTYMFVTTIIFLPLFCEQDPGDMEYYFVTLPYHRCSTGLQISSALLFVVYVVGLPLAISVFLWRSGVLRSPTGHPRVRYMFSLVLAPYRSSMQFWDLVSFGRNISFVFAFSISPFSALSTMLVCFVLSISAVLQAMFLPYDVSYHNHLASTSFLLLLANYVLRLKAQVLGTTELDVAGSLLFGGNLLLVALLVFLLLRNASRKIIRRATLYRMDRKRRTVPESLHTAVPEELSEGYPPSAMVQPLIDSARSGGLSL